LCFLLCNYRGGGGVWNFDLGIFGDKTLFQASSLRCRYLSIYKYIVSAVHQKA
jgi:hypothetical protein